jgi:hypothetical protein
VDALALNLPLLHVMLILEKLAGVDPTAVSDLVALLRAIDAVHTASEARIAEIVSAARTMGREKAKLCRTFSDIMDTSEPGLDQPPPSVIRLTTLADFVFIKNRSSGAYAHVFLARKALTGDTFAMKVMPISTFGKASELKRVPAEKDILLQFENPFIVNFCRLFPFKIEGILTADTQTTQFRDVAICTLRWSSCLAVTCTRFSRK